MKEGPDKALLRAPNFPAILCRLLDLTNGGLCIVTVEGVAAGGF
jgi:hypothetical protein